jgi:hypothetical protein
MRKNVKNEADFDSSLKYFYFIDGVHTCEIINPGKIQPIRP